MTSATSISIQPAAAEQAPKAANLPQSTASPSPRQSSVLGWAAAKVGACLHTLSCPAAGALIVTSVFLLVRYKNKTRPKRGPITRSMSLALMHGGEKAIQRFKEFQKMSVEEAKLKEALKYIHQQLKAEKIDFVDLYAKIGIFEMTEKEDEVIKLFKEAVAKTDEHTHTAHELKLLLAEMLIYKGEFNEALDCLPSDDVSSPADARVPLYKAVIYILTNKQDLASQHFEKYIEIRQQFHGNKFYKEGLMHLHVSDFKEFKDLVRNIQKQIHSAHEETDPAPKAEDPITQPALETRVDTPKSTQPDPKTPVRTPKDSQAGGN